MRKQFTVELDTLNTMGAVRKVAFTRGIFGYLIHT